MAREELIFYVAASLLLGIFFAGLTASFWLIGLSLAAAAAFLFLRRRWPLLRILLAIIVLMAGFFYFHIFLNFKVAKQKLPTGETEFSGQIASEPKIFGKVQVFTLKLKEPFASEIDVLTSPTLNFDYGDSLVLRGMVEPAQSPVDNPQSFFPEFIEREKSSGFSLKGSLLEFKHLIIADFKHLLPPDEAAFLGGLTFGARSELSPDLREKMRRSGTTHLVALSGYNIAVLISVVGLILQRRIGKRITFFTTVILIVLFVMMTGAEPSVIRAAIMGFLLILAQEAGRIYSLRNAIVYAALLMALADPTVLLFNLGFELSFASLLGIVLVSPQLLNFVKRRIKSASLIWESAATTAGAQLAVLPILVLNFGEFSPTALLANVLILGLIPLTMALGFILAALALVYFPLGFLISIVAKILLAYEIAVMSVFSKLYLPLGGWLENWFLGMLYYGVLGLIVLAMAKQQARQ